MKLQNVHLKNSNKDIYCKNQHTQSSTSGEIL